MTFLEFTPWHMDFFKGEMDPSLDGFRSRCNNITELPIQLFEQENKGNLGKTAESTIKIANTQQKI